MQKRNIYFYPINIIEMKIKNKAGPNTKKKPSIFFRLLVKLIGNYENKVKTDLIETASQSAIKIK